MLPLARRNSTGEMDGSAAMMTVQALYDVAGQIRATLIELQSQVRTAQGDHDAQGR